jgi:hypothetical protein
MHIKNWTPIESIAIFILCQFLHTLKHRRLLTRIFPKCRFAAVFLESRMARRGSNLFKRNDGVRALKIAREGGIEPAMIEIVAKDGTIFRVYGDNAALTETTQDCTGAKAWNEEIAKLKAATPKAKGR